MSTLSLLSWNINQKEAAWEDIVDSGVDVALVQEAKLPPSAIREKLVLDVAEPWEYPGRFGRAAVVGVSDRIDFMPLMTQPLGGNDSEALMISRPATLSVAKLRILATGEDVWVASMYGNWANPLKAASNTYLYADASVHRLISDLSALLKRSDKSPDKKKIIAAGDLNILYGYGEGRNKYWEKRYDTVFQRMEALGFEFLGPQAPTGGKQAEPWPKELPEDSKNVPTFYHSRKNPETASRQLDFVFATSNIANRIKVRAANRPDEWGSSDHCRVFIDMD